MKVTSLPDAEPRARKVAVGTFDGVHLGHREVIRGNDTVLTFDPHPLSVLAPQALPKLLDSPATKRDLIAGLGVEELVTIPFDRDFASKSAEQFIEEVLVEKLGADPRVGGGELPLRPEGEGRSRPAALAERVRDAGRAAGRGRERDGLLDSHPRARRGRRRRASRALPRRAVHARGRGRGRRPASAASSASRPRTSCPQDHLAHPGHGIYAAWAHGHMAAVNVGVRPTFETGRGLLVEAYLIDFDADLYGQILRIAFVKRLRGERRFESAEALAEQMAQDVEDARNVLLRFPADVADG